MFPPSEPVTPPSSYNTLNLPHIKLSHVPPSSPTPTSVIQITLFRPESNNAFTSDMQESLEMAYKMLHWDDRVKVVVLTGAGRMFCAGADLGIGFLGTSQNPKVGRDAEHRDGGGRVALAMHQCSKPTVAAINGSAVGVGMTMTLPAAIRVVYKKAKVGFVFARRGIVMEACSAFFLPRLIGHSRALHICTTGSVYPADHPLLDQLFSEVLDTPEATLKRAHELADEIAKNTSTVSTKLMRDLMYRGPQSAEEMHLVDSRVLHGLYGGKDNLEGVMSFKEKRDANFTGTMVENAPEAWPWWPQVDIGYKKTVARGGSKL